MVKGTPKSAWISLRAIFKHGVSIYKQKNNRSAAVANGLQWGATSLAKA